MTNRGRSPTREEPMQRRAGWRVGWLGAMLLLLLALPSAALASQGTATDNAATRAQQTCEYRVVPGDTLFSIARRNNTTVNELMRLNGLTNPNLIYVGQCLRLRGGTTPPPAPTPPPGSTPVPPPGESQVHVVRPGDTIYSIGRLYGVTPQAIIQANGLANPNLIYVGQRLTIPRGGTTPPPAPPPPGSTPVPPAPGGMIWGAQASMLNEDMGRITRAASEMNLSWLKQQIRWSDFEPTPGNILWGPMDALVEGAGDKRLLFSVLAAPDWARAAGTDINVVGPPGDPATYANFVGQLAARYCGKVVAIEVWNEQNLAREWGNEQLSAVRYMQLLKAAYPAIKQACPVTTVVSGALTPTGAPPPAAIDDFTYLTQMYQNGLRQFSDAVGVHPSGYNLPPTLYYTQACNYIQQTGATFRGPCNTPHHSWTFRSTLEGTRNIMVQWNDSGKKLWVTEFGWAVGSGTLPAGYEYAADNSREEQAGWTSQAFSIGRNSGYVGAMFLWNLNFAIVMPGSEQALWGVYGPNFSPTITVPAVRDTPH